MGRKEGGDCYELKKENGWTNLGQARSRVENKFKSRDQNRSKPGHQKLKPQWTQRSNFCLNPKKNLKTKQKNAKLGLKWRRKSTKQGKRR